MAASDDERIELHRAFGRMEGRFGALESRVVNLETTTDRRLEAIAKKLQDNNDSMEGKVDEVARVVHTLETREAGDRGTFKGGWIVAGVIFSVLTTVATFVISIMNMAAH